MDTQHECRPQSLPGGPQRLGGHPLSQNKYREPHPSGLDRVSKRGEACALGEARENTASSEGIARKHPLNADSTRYRTFGPEVMGEVMGE